MHHGQEHNNVYCARDVVMRPTGYKKLPDDLHLPDEEDLGSVGGSEVIYLCVWTMDIVYPIIYILLQLLYFSYFKIHNEFFLNLIFSF